MLLIHPILTLCYTTSVVFIRDWKLALLNCVAFLFIEMGIFFLAAREKATLADITLFYIIPFGLSFLVSRLKTFNKRPWIFVLLGPIFFYTINIWAVQICKIFGYK